MVISLLYPFTNESANETILKNEKLATELDCIVSKDKQRNDAIQQALDSSTVLSPKVIIIEQIHLLLLLEHIPMWTLLPLKKRQLSSMICKSSWPMKIWFVKSLSNICKTQKLLNGIEKDNKQLEETLKTQEGAVITRIYCGQRGFARQEIQGRIDDFNDASAVNTAPTTDATNDTLLPLPDDTDDEAKEQAKVQAKTKVATTTMIVKIEQMIKTPF
ncbi:hypothetical protein RFI_02224 [Reticulomyxa filosa]|uniref:Uncharacterized protein n=1 Tax=Reticulomyxa filosa TaxID=46433 RepID=X6P9S8_RETFI|nr:hypothetical protein RFI_02224 [Reticulomyxa filosa]|eukprot:ETO34863.1 hypothetical protein RFI_02224 [Reticulomyxa filosa]